jgi:hydroxymethylbilane synthase
VSREIRVGSRESALAAAQAKIVMDGIARFHPEISLNLVTMKSRGDLLPDLPLGGAESGGKALFTGTLEAALARSEVDICVHSLKDMGDSSPELPIVAMPRRGNPFDALVLPQDEEFRGLAALERACTAQGGNSPVLGCSSPRRRVQLHRLAPLLRCAPIRGNVPTRLSKLDQGLYGALVLAAAGLERLGLEGRISHIFNVREMIPAAGQGILAIQGRRGEDYAFLEEIRHPPTEAEARAERAFIRAAGGGCAFPAAAFARISGGEICLEAVLAGGSDSPVCRDTVNGPLERGLALAEELAQRLIQRIQN